MIRSLSAGVHGADMSPVIICESVDECKLQRGLSFDERCVRSEKRAVILALLTFVATSRFHRHQAVWYLIRILGFVALKITHLHGAQHPTLIRLEGRGFVTSTLHADRHP